jgi:hypothetical protein
MATARHLTRSSTGNTPEISIFISFQHYLPCPDSAVYFSNTQVAIVAEKILLEGHCVYLLPRYTMQPTGDSTTAVPVQNTSSASSNSSISIRRSSTWKQKGMYHCSKGKIMYCCSIGSEQKTNNPVQVTWNSRFPAISIILLLVIPGRIVPVNSGVIITVSCQKKAMLTFQQNLVIRN